MGWRNDLIRIGITAGIAASMGKGGKDRARKALEAAFPDLQNLVSEKSAEKDDKKGKAK